MNLGLKDTMTKGTEFQSAISVNESQPKDKTGSKERESERVH